jgi:hypothetical protein
MKKDGGQLFTYFKFSNKPDVIMLYASELKGNEIVYHNEIEKIETEISKLEMQLSEIPIQKEKILRKYL